MKSETPPSPPARFVTLLPPLMMALAAAGLGLLIGPNQWSSIFQTDLAFPDAHHPLRETAIAGGKVLRVMLLVLAATLVGGVLIWRRIDPSPAPDQTRDEVSGRELWLITGLLALGLIMRLPRLGESLWFDEIASWAGFGSRGPGWIVGTYFDPANHILHNLLTWCSAEWLGADALALRIPALLFSLGAIVPLYMLGRGVAGRRVGFFAGLLMAIAPVAVLEGVESRGYSMMIFFAALDSLLLLRAWRRPGGLIWFAYALCAALGVWAHLTTVFVPLGHGGWVAWQMWRGSDRQKLLPAIAALVIAAVLTLTLYAPVLPQMIEIRATFATVEGNEPRLLGPEGLHALWQLGGSWTWWAALGGLVLAGIGANRARSDLAVRRILALTLLGLPLMVLVIAIAGSWLYARFMLFALPGALLAMALGLDGVWHWKREAGFLAVTAMVAAITTDLSLLPPKQPLREAVDAIRSSIAPGERVLGISLAREFDVYGTDLGITYSQRHGRNLADTIEAGHPTWVIMDYPENVDHDVHALLTNAGFQESARFTGWVDWTNGDVVVYQRRD